MKPSFKHPMLVSFIVFVLGVCGSGASASVVAGGPLVRVAIAEEIPEALFSVLVPYRITDVVSGRLLGEGTQLMRKQVRAAPDGLQIGKTVFRSESILLEPLEKSVVYVNSRSYRGGIIFRKVVEDKITAINVVDLEEYLISALASEVSSEWPAEVLKAHAVVSRTVVAHRMWINKDRPYDLTADARSHMYNGASAERVGSKKAVLATKGRVLVYKGQLLSAAFHSNCGGHTEKASEIWNEPENIAPLEGVKDPYCKGLRHFEWNLRLSWGQLRGALGDVGEKLGPLISCEIVQKNVSGRVRSVRVYGMSGSAEMTGRRLRQTLGANRLKSLKFEMMPAKEGVIFQGYGWGHGVGLCQWGAYGMARKGKSMDDILSFYFPRTSQKDLQSIPPFSN